MKEQHGPIKESYNVKSGGQGQAHFGNYDLVRRIDVGGMGEVYLARQRTAFGREVALKIMRSDLVHDAVARKRFLREAEVSAHLKHEHILPLFEFGEEQGRLFLVTPYIEGGTLARRLQSGALVLSEVHQLFSALVKAVAYIHKRGVIHRDLKPSNILLDREEGSDQIYVRLIDFGIASIPGATVSAPLTRAGHEMGTIAYMAPERLDGIAATSNDIYSLGIILYQMLTGHLPEQGEMLHLPPALDYVVKRSIAPDPDDRFARADELLKAFESAYRSLLTSAQAVSHTGPQATRAQVAPNPDDDDDDDAPTPRRLPSMANGQQTNQQNKALHTGVIAAPHVPIFSSEDYDAPTTFIDPEQVNANVKQVNLADGGVLITTTPHRRKARKSLLALIPLLIAAILLVASGSAYFFFQASIVANVTMALQAREISKVITISAKPGLQNVDANAAAIPAYTLSASRTLSKTGQTTGRPFLCIFDCERVVSSDDVYNLGIETKQSLMSQLTQDMNGQLQGKGATMLGKPTFNDTNSSFDPQVGKRSNSVTVTLTEQGSVQYILNKDAQNLARLLLQRQVQQQLGTNYTLLNQLTQVGQPVLQKTGSNGSATIAIPVGGVAEYQMSDAQIKALQNNIKGLKVPDAGAVARKVAGIDSNSVVVHVSYGDTIPGNVGQIKINLVNPTNLPAVHLPAAPTPPPSGTADNNNNDNGD
ncbi:serine/threonine protein kinase [Ktedonosporobacter rubrisoli]|uniref:non-specific serine/threonine protein kinase n=1 Tax=Ktedonosporobacter rubrisoli TaxID=2509675 RepID=A0A4P6JWB6_KTERU|nr:serine/threonine-protein kinase [Ktedonosporobacter rubrisoli]QBD79988.1 serine/threonine protein kinase [Ktedonosporobacter rubrisoli]